jgi:D-serine deaminase-like pyridoxal phosphate-dependent protein
MSHSLVGLTIEDVETPALLLDLDRLDANIDLMARTIAAGGKKWRPHAKAFKTPCIAHRLQKAGAIGITVAKVSEAEVMAAGGIEDILIAHLVVGPARASRLASLQRIADVKATVDHPDQLSALSDAAWKIGVTIGLLVDLDIGLGRTGVPDVDQAAQLAVRVAESRGLRFDGLMGYEGHAITMADQDAKREAVEKSYAKLRDGIEAVANAGLPCPIVSTGGSGTYPIAATLAGPTELQAGGGIFGCRYYTDLCNLEGIKPALQVLTTVVSRPADDRAVLDAGRKAISNYLSEPSVFNGDFSLARPDLQVTSLSAEHATIRILPSSDFYNTTSEELAMVPRERWDVLFSHPEAPRIGDRLRLIPGYSDLTFVLHDEVIAFREIAHMKDDEVWEDEVVEAIWSILGRGCLQ